MIVVKSNVPNEVKQNSVRLIYSLIFMQIQLRIIEWNRARLVMS